jgi:hypothetical protein
MLRLCSVLSLVFVGLTRPSMVAQVTGMRGMSDHSLCCAIGMPNVHGIDGTFEPAPDPILSRRRAPAPPPPATPAGAKAPVGSTNGLHVDIPGTDTFVRETAVVNRDVENDSDDLAAEIDALAEPEYPPLQMPKRKTEGYLDVGFETLGGYAFKLTKAQATAVGAGDAAALAAVNAQIPDLIRQLDGKKVMVTGFMLPMKMEGTLTTEFLLVANSMLCCYGVVPPMNQWITVKMTKRGVKPEQDVPMQVFGTLRVKTRVENGALAAIYHLEADRTRQPK